jgi:hypothetical protein
MAVSAWKAGLLVEGVRTPDLRIANGFDGPMHALTCSAIQEH